jgi:hypothetical protein
VSSEHFEESEASEEVEVVESRELSEEENLEATIEEEMPEPEDLKILYDVTRPELLETMMIASDILTQATLGQLSLSEAKRLYEREVSARIRKLVTGGVVVKRKPKARKAKTEKKTEKKGKGRVKAKEKKTEKKAKTEEEKGKKARRKAGGSPS